MTDGELYLFLRGVLSRGMEIQYDITNKKFGSFIEGATHQDNVARECVKEFRERFGLPSHVASAQNADQA